MSYTLAATITATTRNGSLYVFTYLPGATEGVLVCASGTLAGQPGVTMPVADAYAQTQVGACFSGYGITTSPLVEVHDSGFGATVRADYRAAALTKAGVFTEPRAFVEAVLEMCR